MPKFMRKMVLTVKPETTYGTDPTPTNAANAFLVSDVTLVPLEGDEVKNDEVQPYFGATASVMATAYQSISFHVRFSGVATLGAVPAIADILRGCGARVVTEAGVKSSLLPVTDNMESVTYYCVIDGMLYKATGARGNAEITADARGLPRWKIDLQGLWTPVTDVAAPTGMVYTRFQPLLPINNANTTVSLAGLAVACSKFSFNFGNTVAYENLTAVEDVTIGGRTSTGSITFRDTAVTEKDWVSLSKDKTPVPLVLRHGQTPTNTIKLLGDRVELGKPSYSEQQGIKYITLPMTFLPSAAGNDEWAIEY